ncbi:MAG: hydrogen peroxide-inducible genes activator [Chitinophagaceae bacterium]|nr:hydrogen peroxide-inducible genes activator [Chitinophagaceae bacterium]MCW5905784.1 hydrogen peroxide-inducible genes activator [Chitinophagaceae bacterium]
MTLTQLEYIIAVNTFRHFAKAAEHCHVTQPTLSMQIQKLEETLNIQIFDRNKQPVVPTNAGIDIIEQAKKILGEVHIMTEIVQQKKGQFAGELKIGIIPTLAPYLLPLFIASFTKKYPNIKLIVHELTTNNIIIELLENRIDAGILVTPLQQNNITEQVLFYEEMMAYVSKNSDAYKKTFVLAKDIAPEKLWLLEEGHCFRSQIEYLCELKKQSEENRSFEYEAGSFETLRKMVDINGGITVLPEMATNDFSAKQEQQIRHFKNPIPVREVSIVMHKHFAKKRLIETLKKEIIAVIPEKLKKNKKAFIVPIEVKKV